MTDMPDFDSMSPEEMMKWMESLAKRQGVDESTLLTSADAEVSEVSEDDERLAGMGEYKPYGMSDDDWEKLKAKEAAEKEARRAAQSKPQPEIPVAHEIDSTPPTIEPEPEPVASTDAGDMPDFDSMSPEEMMKWMESLAKRQGVDESTLLTSADAQVAEVSEDDERLAGMGEYKPYGMSDDDWEKLKAKEAAEKQARRTAQPKVQPAPPTPTAAEEELAAALEGDVLAAPSFEDILSGTSNLIEEADEEEEAIPDFGDFFGSDDETELPEFDFSALDTIGAAAESEAGAMDWLEGLAAPEADSGAMDFDMSALGDLGALGDESSVEATGDPMAWLAGLAEDGGEDDVAESEEGSLEWMESLAKTEGADSEELFTSAGLDIPQPGQVQADGPGYEEYSFEQGAGMVIDDDEEPEPVPSFDLGSLEDPENWLDQLASAQSGTAPVGAGEFDEEAEEEVHDYDSVASDVQSKLAQGTASPEEIEQFFKGAFRKAATRTDVPDYIDSDDEEEAEIPPPVQAEIPDWLQEQMGTVPEAESPAQPAKTDTAEMMLKNLGLDEEAEAVPELPDWLTEDISDDTGNIAMDIFDTMDEGETEPAQATELSITDTSDSWVQAFEMEASGKMEEWYEQQVAHISEDESAAVAQEVEQPEAAPVPGPVAAVSAGGLQSAELPLETILPQGQAMAVPAWLGGEVEEAPPEPISAADMSSVEAEAVEDIDWLSTEDTEAFEADMPDWLKEQVDDTVTGDAELPEWLAGEDIDIESVDEIPDWLRETMEDEQEVMPSFPQDLVQEAIPEPEPEPAPPPPVVKQPAPPVQKPVSVPVPVQQSPAPVPVSAAVDVAAALQSAEQKTGKGDIDGALLDYESVIRANQALDQVEKAIAKLADSNAYKRNPAVYRVLGDVQMRQGKLQEALDTYRRALNML